ncbi:MAG TPA: DoxX family protein [Casimicrobiaceae bacterium]
MNGQSVNDDIKDWAALLGRMLMAILFVVSGFGKIPGFEGTVGYISQEGLPFPQLLAALAILFELGGGIAIAIGWKTRLAALALALFMIVITPVFHRFWGLPTELAMQQQIHFMKNVAVLGGILMLYAFGPGRYSVDKG